jgi:hypothetical protein
MTVMIVKTDSSGNCDGCFATGSTTVTTGMLGINREEQSQQVDEFRS